MPRTTTIIPLVDGSLMRDARAQRQELLARMAAELVRYAAYADTRYAIGVLSALGYARGDIDMMIDDARALEAVAAAMVMP